MTLSHGKDLVFQLDTQAGSLKNLSACVKSVSGLPGSVELGDVTTGGSAGKKSYPGLMGASFSAVMVFDDDTDKSFDVVKDFQTDTDTRSFEFGPKGSTATYPKISGECRIKNIDFNCNVNNPNEITVNFESDGTITIGTYSA